MSDVYPDLSVHAYFGIVLGISVLVVAVLGPLLQLLFFHFMLGTCRRKARPSVPAARAQGLRPPEICAAPGPLNSAGQCTVASPRTIILWARLGKSHAAPYRRRQHQLLHKQCPL